MKQTVDIIEDIVKLLTPTLVIDSQSTSNGVITIQTKNTYWLHTANTIEISGNKFKVVDFTINQSLSLKPKIDGTTINVDSFVIPAPKYYHGTHKMTKQEVNSEDDKVDIVPMVWLREIIRDDQTHDETSAIERESDLMLIFLDSADTENWLTDDHYENVIEPIDQMVDLFIEKISDSRFFTETFNYERTAIVNASINGDQENSIFDFNLSGKMIRLFAEIRKDLNCT